MSTYEAASRRRKLSRSLLLALIAVLAVAIAYLLGLVLGGRSRAISSKKLRCVVSQNVTPFDDRILYYDSGTLFCLSAGGGELWKVSVGEDAQFYAGTRQVVVWSGNQLMLFDKNGRPTYSDRLNEPIQFARVGTKYLAVVTGSGVSPTLTIRDADGTQLDEETIDYEDLMMLDCGFFGDGEYLWTTALDVYGSAPEITMHIYLVGQKNTGYVTLGESITYAVIYSGKYLNVINTRQLRLFDYRGVESTEDAKLVYGWQLVGSTVTSGSPYLLFAPNLQTDAGGTFTELRLLHGASDTRYSLPDACVGAAIRGKKLYAFSSDSLYRADISAQSFSALRLPVDGPVTDYLGMTSGGVALLVCGTEVWAVTLP
ncbi:MAG: hypothetical protein IJS53_02385 [Clostridia bacterium]|nr:hypothetical protein [Clostridia bacterium]